MGDLRAVEPLIVAVEDKDLAVQWAACDALKKFGGQRAIEAVEAWYNNPDRPIPMLFDTDPQEEEREKERGRQARDLLKEFCLEFRPAEAQRLLGNLSFKELKNRVESKRKQK